ncbi:hypothetical protein LJR290_007956 [Variovorax sp. LjRoot290]|uniref:hypothetical protein n=1 Tax=Variovorax sp. LjRoot290 TaxID=3342316 RepID=UPI003ECC8E0E
MQNNQDRNQTSEADQDLRLIHPDTLQTARNHGSGPNPDRSQTGQPVEPLSNWYESAVQPVNEDTAVFYRKRYFMMVDRVALALNKDPDFVSIEDLIENLAADPALAPGTKTTYRAAIVWALNQPDMDFSAEIREKGLALAREYNPRLGSAQAIQMRRSRASARAIPEQDLGPLLNGLLAARPSLQNWGAKTTAWLNAGIATGARPGEWETAFWLDRDRNILRLPNLKLKKQPFFNWRHIPERLLNRADADLAAMAGADQANVSAVLEAAERHAELVSRNLAFFDQAEAMVDVNNEVAIENLRRLRAWELRNAGLAWRDVEVPYRWVGAVDAHLSSLQQYLASGDEHTFERYFNGCRTALYAACNRAFPDGRKYSLYDTRSTAAANMKATVGPEVAAMVMGHYMKRKRTIAGHYAGSDRAFRRAGRFAPGLADTQNQRDQAADRAAEQQSAADTLGTGEARAAAAPDAPTIE